MPHKNPGSCSGPPAPSFSSAPSPGGGGCSRALPRPVLPAGSRRAVGPGERPEPLGAAKAMSPQQGRPVGRQSPPGPRPLSPSPSPSRTCRWAGAPRVAGEMRSPGPRRLLALRLLLLLLLALSACAPPSNGPPGHGPGHWSYSDKALWASDFPHCGGHMQSPINIDTSTTLFAPQLKPFQLSGYHLPPEEMLSLRNNGHTIVLGLPANMSMSGGGLPQAYLAAQLHLHWGSQAEPGSEHTVDGHRYAGEAGPEENEAYQHILEYLDEVHEEGEEASVAGFDIAKLLPDNLHAYFRYNGSLTTPPCYQTVNWTIFNQTVLLSQEQISTLEESLLGGEREELLQGNFRLPQRLHGRRVMASFSMPPAAPPVTERPDAGKQASPSLHTGDLLAILFGTLFGLTAIAFLLYVRKHRGQRQRLHTQATQPSITYVAATTEEHTGEDMLESSRGTTLPCPT